MNKKVIYIGLVLECILAFCSAVMACVDGPSGIIEIFAAFLLVGSFVGIVSLFAKNKSKQKMNLVDLLISMVVILMNHWFLGSVFGWTQCPYI